MSSPSPLLESGKNSRWSRPKKSLPTLFSVSSESSEMRLRNRSLYDKMEYEQNSFDSGIDASFLSNPDCFASPPRKEPLLSPSPDVSELLPSLSDAFRQWRRRRVALFDSEETKLTGLNALVGVVILTSAIFALLLLVNKVNFDVDNLQGGKYAAIQFAFDKRNALLGDANNVLLGDQGEVLNGKRASIQFAHVKRRSVADTSDESQEANGFITAVPEAPVRPEVPSVRREKLSAAPPLKPPQPMQSDDNVGKESKDAEESEGKAKENEGKKETNVKEAKEKSKEKQEDVSKDKSGEGNKANEKGEVKRKEEQEMKAEERKDENEIKVEKAKKGDKVLEPKKKASDKIKPSSSPIHVRMARSPQSKPFRLNPTQEEEQSSSDQGFRIN